MGRSYEAIPHMRVYTYQVAQWRRLANQPVPLLDTTVKSGDPRLAPTWDMVMGVKKGSLSEEEYTRLYLARLEFYWFHEPDFFHWLLSHEDIALGCYCKAGKFCHRYLLVDFLTRGASVEYAGEL